METDILQPLLAGLVGILSVHFDMTDARKDIYESVVVRAELLVQKAPYHERVADINVIEARQIITALRSNGRYLERVTDPQTRKSKMHEMSIEELDYYFIDLDITLDALDKSLHE
jgi:hypothetical protein